MNIRRDYNKRYEKDYVLTMLVDKYLDRYHHENQLEVLNSWNLTNLLEILLSGNLNRTERYDDYFRYIE